MAPKKREKRSAENANASLEGIKDNAFVANISSVSSRKTDIQNMLNYRNRKANLSSDRSLFVVGLSGDLKLKAIVHCFCYTVLGSSEVMDASSLTTNSSSQDRNATVADDGVLICVLALCCNCLFTMLKSDDLYLILISSSIPKITPLADLRPYDNGKVIEVKVYCIWIARNPPDQTPLGYCVILLDEMGNTISGKCFRYKILQLGSRHRQSLYCK